VSAYVGETPLDVGLRSGEIVEQSTAAFCKEGACYHCEAEVLVGGKCITPIVADGDCVRLCRHKIADTREAASMLSVRLFATADDVSTIVDATTFVTTPEAPMTGDHDDLLFV